MWFCFGLNPTGISYLIYKCSGLFSFSVLLQNSFFFSLFFIKGNDTNVKVSVGGFKNHSPLCQFPENWVVFRKTLHLVRLSLPQRSGINSHCGINCQSPVIWSGFNKLDWCLFDHLLASRSPGLHVAECWCPGRNCHTGEVGWGSGVCLGGYDRKSKCHLWSLRPSCSTDSV